jgi:hypothetical protein
MGIFYFILKKFCIHGSHEQQALLHLGNREPKSLEAIVYSIMNPNTTLYSFAQPTKIK